MIHEFARLCVIAGKHPAHNACSAHRPMASAEKRSPFMPAMRAKVCRIDTKPRSILFYALCAVRFGQFFKHKHG